MNDQVSSPAEELIKVYEPLELRNVEVARPVGKVFAADGGAEIVHRVKEGLCV